MKKVFLVIAILGDLAFMRETGYMLLNRVHDIQARATAEAQKKLAPVPEPVSKRKIVFNLKDPKAKKVELMGDVTGWKPEPLTSSADHAWSIEVSLAPGKYNYYFLVNDKAVLDPANPHKAPDGNSSILSVP